MITQEELKSALEYNHETGVFAWVINSPRTSKGLVAGSLNQKGYRRIRINTQRYVAHRLAWLYVYGEWPCGQLDHINHNRDDNRISNLRVVTNQENAQNRKRPLSSLGIAGVFWRKADKCWASEIKVSGSTASLGYYKSYFDACCARKSAEIYYAFHPNHFR